MDIDQRKWKLIEDNSRKQRRTIWIDLDTWSIAEEMAGGSVSRFIRELIRQQESEKNEQITKS